MCVCEGVLAELMREQDSSPLLPCWEMWCTGSERGRGVIRRCSPRPVIGEPSVQSAVVESTSAPEAQVEGRRPKPMHEKPCWVKTNCDAGTLSLYCEMTSLYSMASCSEPEVE